VEREKQAPFQPVDEGFSLRVTSEVLNGEHAGASLRARTSRLTTRE